MMTLPDPSHDFDFLFGTWRVRHRRLKERLAGCDEWEVFDGTQTVWPIADGHANIDDARIELPEGAYHGISLRSYDKASRRWAIWWLDARHPHTLDVPVIGRFEGGTGLFHADDTLRGRPIKVRFTWSRITPQSAQWDQAFSPDGGRSWETNWIMALDRTS